MARRKRLQFPGGVYHVMSRGNRKATIFEDDDDRLLFLSTVNKAAERYSVRVYEFCLMGNHYHLLLDTPRGNLSDAMCYINGVFTQSSNWRHNRTGHLLGGRFLSLVVPREIYLKRVSRYIVLNPVKAGFVAHPSEWPWSSYRASVGLEAGPPFLHHGWMDWAFDTTERSEAQLAYRAYVNEALIDGTPASDDTTDDVLQELQELARAKSRDRLVPQMRDERERPPIDQLLHGTDNAPDMRKLRIYEAHTIHGYRLSEIAKVLNVHPSTPGIIVRRFRAGRRSGKPHAP